MNIIDKIKEMMSKLTKAEEEIEHRVFIYRGSMAEFEKDLTEYGVKIEKNATALFNLYGLDCIEIIPAKCVLIGNRKDIDNVLKEVFHETKGGKE